MEYSDAQILDSLLLLGKLRRMSCPYCRTITANPLGSQIEFAHWVQPDVAHRCFVRMQRYQGVSE